MLPVILSRLKEATGGEVRKNTPLNSLRLTSSMSANALLHGLQWMVLVIDDAAKKLIDNAVNEDDILNNNIASTCRRPVLPLTPMSLTHVYTGQTSSDSRTREKRTRAWAPSTSSPHKSTSSRCSWQISKSSDTNMRICCGPIRSNHHCESA